MSERMSATELHQHLAQFHVGRTYYYHQLGKLRYTEGVKFLADNGGAHWLIDIIASYQIIDKLTRGKFALFQVWLLVPRENGAATLTCHEGTETPAVVTQEIECTDFPFCEGRAFELHVLSERNEMKTLLLPQEV